MLKHCTELKNEMQKQFLSEQYMNNISVLYQNKHQNNNLNA